MVFVSHDLALVAQIAHHITVMYAGQVVSRNKFIINESNA